MHLTFFLAPGYAASRAPQQVICRYIYIYIYIYEVRFLTRTKKVMDVS